MLVYTFITILASLWVAGMLIGHLRKKKQQKLIDLKAADGLVNLGTFWHPNFVERTKVVTTLRKGKHGGQEIRVAARCGDVYFKNSKTGALEKARKRTKGKSNKKAEKRHRHNIRKYEEGAKVGAQAFIDGLSGNEALAQCPYELGDIRRSGYIEGYTLTQHQAKEVQNGNSEA
jgi:hypothetical protein